MKFIFAHTVSFPGRAANTVQVAKTCGVFARIGCEVTLAIPRNRGARMNDGDKLKQIAEAYGIAPSFAVRQIPFYGLPWRELALGAAAALFARFSKTDFLFTRSISVARAASILGIPTVLEMHHSLDTLRPLLVRRFDALVRSRSFLLLVVISEKLKAYYEQRSPALAGRIFSSPLGGDVVEHASPKLDLGDQFHVGYVGHLYPGKGLEIVLPLARICPWAVFHIVGGDPRNLELWQSRAADIPNLIFHGHVPHARVPEFLASFDVMLAPYQRIVEGVGGDDNNLADWMSPLKIFEYMAHGKAIICSDLAVLHEILEDRKTALLCPPEDVAAWAAALTQLRDEPELKGRLETQAKETMERNFTREARARRLLDIVSHQLES